MVFGRLDWLSREIKIIFIGTTNQKLECLEEENFSRDARLFAWGLRSDFHSYISLVTEKYSDIVCCLLKPRR